jgi:C-terminal processing protease CtpA/Prc
VKTVKPGGSADHSGKVEANDVITHLNGKQVINCRLDVVVEVRGGV